MRRKGENAQVNPEKKTCERNVYENNAPRVDEVRPVEDSGPRLPLLRPPRAHLSRAHPRFSWFILQEVRMSKSLAAAAHRCSLVSPRTLFDLWVSTFDEYYATMLNSAISQHAIETDQFEKVH